MSQGAPRVLIVEDNVDIRETLSLGLEIEGYDVLQANDGIEALSVLSTHALPDIILLDMLMPRMNGWEFVDQIRRDPEKPEAKIPIIALTATSEKVVRAPGEMNAVLRKPFEFQALLQLLTGLFAEQGRVASR